MVEYHKQNPNLSLQELIAQGKEALPEFKEIVHNIFSDLKEAHPDLFKSATVETNEKAENRIIEKVEGDYEGVCSRITDIIRGRIIVDSLEEVQIARDYAQNMPNEYDVTSLKDRFASPTESGFRDVNMTIRLSNGHVAEFRFEQEDMVEYGKMTHYIYEKTQEIERAAKEEAEQNGYAAPRYTQEQEDQLEINGVVSNYLHQVGADIVDQDACLDEASKKRILEAHLEGAALEVATPDAGKKIHELVEEAKEAVRLEKEKHALEKQLEAENRLETLAQEAAEARALADQKAVELEQAQALADEKAQIAEQTAAAAAGRIERLEYSTQLLQDEMESLPSNEAAVNARACEENQAEIAELNAEIARTAAEAEVAREIAEKAAVEHHEAEVAALVVAEAHKEEEVRQKEEEARLAEEASQQKAQEAQEAAEIAEHKEQEAIEAQKIAEQKAEEAREAEEIALEKEEAKISEEAVKQANEEAQEDKEIQEAEELAKQKAIEAEEARAEADLKAEEAKEAEAVAKQKAEEALEAKEDAALKAEEAQHAESFAEDKAVEAQKARAELVEDTTPEIEAEEKAAAQELTAKQTEQANKESHLTEEKGAELAENTTAQDMTAEEVSAAKEVTANKAEQTSENTQLTENAVVSATEGIAVEHALQNNAQETSVTENVAQVEPSRQERDKADFFALDENPEMTAEEKKLVQLEYSSHLLQGEMENLPPNEVAVNEAAIARNQAEIAELKEGIAHSTTETAQTKQGRTTQHGEETEGLVVTEESATLIQSEATAQPKTTEARQGEDATINLSNAVEHDTSVTMLEAGQGNVQENNVADQTLGNLQAELPTYANLEEGMEQTAHSEGTAAIGSIVQEESAELAKPGDPPVSTDKNEVFDTVESQLEDEVHSGSQKAGESSDQEEVPAVQQNVQQAVDDSSKSITEVETTSVYSEPKKEEIKEDFAIAATQVTSMSVGSGSLGGNGSSMCFFMPIFPSPFSEYGHVSVGHTRRRISWDNFDLM